MSFRAEICIPVNYEPGHELVAIRDEAGSYGALLMPTEKAQELTLILKSHDALVGACAETVKTLKTRQEAYGMETTYAEMFGLDEELALLEQALVLAGVKP